MNHRFQPLISAALFTALLGAAACGRRATPSSEQEGAATGIAQAERPGQFQSLSAAPVNTWWFESPDGGLVMFDAQRTLTDARALVEMIRKTGKPLRGIFITHPHPDHITGLGTLKATFPDAAIYSTAEATSYLEGRGKTLLGMNVKMFNADATTEIPRPDVLVSDGQRVTVGGMEIQAKLLGSGESPGTTVYFIPLLHTLVVGDVLTPRRVPFMAGAETAAWLRQIAVLKANYDPGTRVAPGHGPETTLKNAAAWQAAYLTKFRELVATAIDPGSAGGACVVKAEATPMLIEMRRTFPTVEGVARMPPDNLDALNIEGVSYELSRKTCPGVENPVW